MHAGFMPTFYLVDFYRFIIVIIISITQHVKKTDTFSGVIESFLRLLAFQDNFSCNSAGNTL